MGGMHPSASSNMWIFDQFVIGASRLCGLDEEYNAKKVLLHVMFVESDLDAVGPIPPGIVEALLQVQSLPVKEG